MWKEKNYYVSNYYSKPTFKLSQKDYEKILNEESRGLGIKEVDLENILIHILEKTSQEIDKIEKNNNSRGQSEGSKVEIPKEAVYKILGKPDKEIFEFFLKNLF